MDEEMTAVIVAGSVRELPPKLAAAIVAAQIAAGKVQMLGYNGQIKKNYATSDDIGAAAKSALNGAGAAFVRMGTHLEKAALADYDLGNQGYVGDVHERWMIVHESGPAIFGSAVMPVIVSKGRPHEKAVSASQTYLAGVNFRGALGLEREEKNNAVDSREDGGDSRTGRRDRVQKTPDPPRCVGRFQGIADGNGKLTEELAVLWGYDPPAMWKQACAHMKWVDEAGDHPTRAQLTVPDGRKMGQLLQQWLEAETQKAPTS